MQRLLFWLLLCLPLCLLVAPDRYRAINPPPANPSPGTEPMETFATVSDDGAPLPDAAAMRTLAQHDPMSFLEWCIRRCQREVRGCRLMLHKHERIDGQLRLPELIAVDYRVEPFGVLFHWKQNPSLASAVLYSRPDDPDQLLVRPVGLLALGGNVWRSVRGEEAHQSGRYSLEEFGFEMAMRRTLASWRKAAFRGGLAIEFLGIQNRDEVGGRPCYVLHRHHFQHPEESDSINDLVIFIDCETWLQTGSILKNPDNELLGSYFFTDVRLNPPFQKDRFSGQGLKKAPPAGLQR